MKFCGDMIVRPAPLLSGDMMPEVENKTVVGHAEFANKRDVEEFVTGMNTMCGGKYTYMVRKVRMKNDDGRESCIYEVEWLES